MRICKTLIWNPLVVMSLFGLTYFSNPSTANADAGGTCHFHGKKPAEESTVIECAEKRKSMLIKSGKVDSAWASIKHTSIEQVDGKKGKEWKLVFKNPAAKDKSKESLFMFFSLNGNFIAANHTGN